MAALTFAGNPSGSNVKSVVGSAICVNGMGRLIHCLAFLVKEVFACLR
jgi:hypothetical protein